MSEVSAYVLSDRKVIRKEELERYALSKQELEDLFNYDVDGCIVPPYSLVQLAEFLEMNTWHYRCCKVKALDVMGRGWYLKELKVLEDEEEHLRRKEELEEFFRYCNDEESLSEILFKMVLDLEGLGNGYIEVARGLDGKPKKMWHIPAVTVRILKDRVGFLQKTKMGKKVYFKNFGDRRVMDCRTGEFVEKIHWKWQANELIHFKNYSVRNSFYGVPDIIPALGAMVGILKVRDYNIAFFENNAVPQFAVIVEGGEFSKKVEKTIERYFEREIKGQAHKTLFLSVPDEKARIRLEPLMVEVRDASFRLYRQDCREEIIAAHGIPPRRLGIREPGYLSVGAGYSEADMYKWGVIEPIQEKIENRFTNLIIKQGFGYDDWGFKFEDIDIRDRKQEAEIISLLARSGCFSVNEIREMFDYEAVKGGDRIYHEASGMWLDEIGASEEDYLDKIRELLNEK